MYRLIGTKHAGHHRSVVRTRIELAQLPPQTCHAANAMVGNFRCGGCPTFPDLYGQGADHYSFDQLFVVHGELIDWMVYLLDLSKEVAGQRWGQDCSKDC